jgi:hypothetical protein
MSRPRVSGWFASAEKYFMVCGFSSSVDQQTFFVFHVEENVDYVDVHAQGLQWLALLRVLSG